MVVVLLENISYLNTQPTVLLKMIVLLQYIALLFVGAKYWKG